MQRIGLLSIIALMYLCPSKAFGQFDEDKLGAWYMYFWNTTIKDGPIGFQGDIQYRNWNLGGDLEQLLLRGGVTYQPKDTKIKFTLGYGHITTGAFGDSGAKTRESRIYQEALLPQKVGGRFYFTHRFRYEQRFVENQDIRTRFRYNIFINVHLNKKTLEPGAVYLAFYNELFVNGERSIGNGNTVELFDRNRTYGAIGFSVAEGLRIQAGVMRQATDNWQKKQVQLSLHHKI